jgi:hypothetical protein
MPRKKDTENQLASFRAVPEFIWIMSLFTLQTLGGHRRNVQQGSFTRQK